MVKKNYKLVDNADISARIKPGRHLCNCHARIHPLVRNCLSCGRIVCEQEGSGACFYCGTLVCTREEREILEKRDKKSLELLRKIFSKPDLQNFDLLNSDAKKLSSLTSIAESIQTANVYKQKLLFADKDREVTKVNDLQADYFSLELNPYLTGTERYAIVKRKEELRQLSLQAKRNFLVDVDISTGAIAEQQKAPPIETVNDPVLQSILVNSAARNLHQVHKDGREGDNEGDDVDLIESYNPAYKEDLSRSEQKPEEVFAAVLAQSKTTISCLRNANNAVYCIGLRQPNASQLAKMIRSSIPWNDYVDYRGPVLIAALDSGGPNQPEGEAETSSAEQETEEEGAILGRAQLRECLTWTEFNREGHRDALGSTKEPASPFVLIFEDQELLGTPIPYVCPANFFPLDRQMVQAVNATLLSGGGIFDDALPRLAE